MTAAARLAAAACFVGCSGAVTAATPIVPNLSGYRVPGMSYVAPRVLALHRLLSDEEAARAIEHGRARRPPLFPVETTLPATLAALEKGFALKGRSFLEHCCRFLGIGPCLIMHLTVRQTSKYITHVKSYNE